MQDFCYLSTAYMQDFCYLSTAYMQDFCCLSSACMQDFCYLSTAYMQDFCCLSSACMQDFCYLSTAYMQDFCCLSTAYMQDFCCLPSPYMQDFCCLSSEQLVVTERHPPVSAVERVRGTVLRSESLGAAESYHPPSTVAASSRHRFANRASSFAGQILPPSPLTQQVNYVVGPAKEITRDKETPPTAQPGATDSGRSTSASPLPDSILPPYVRRNSVNRASSLSSATTPQTKSNFLAVPDPVIGAGPRRASVIRARSLGNDDAPDVRLATSQAPSISAPGINHVKKTAPATASQLSDNAARCVSPRPTVAASDSAGALSTSLPDRSTSGGVNLLSRTKTDVDKVKVTAPQRMCVGRASSFTTADYAERARRSTRSSKLVHQTSSMLPQSLKMSSDDCVYQRSPSIIPTTQQGLRHCGGSYKMRTCESAKVTTYNMQSIVHQ